MSNRQEIIAKAVTNLEKAVLAMPEDSSAQLPTNPRPSYQTQVTSNSAQTGQAQVPSGAQAVKANQVIIGQQSPKKQSFLSRFNPKRRKNINNQHNAEMAGA